MQGSNYTDELQGRWDSRRESAHQEPTMSTTRSADRSARDRLWVFGTLRFQGNSNYIVNMYENRNAGNPNKWTYEPDLNRQAFKDQTWQNASARITAQIARGTR